jgi:DNA invertase Pin-like site-specific DNA recombinase
LSSATRDLLETIETMRDAGARFQSLSEPWADTTTRAGKMIMTVFAGIAEFERDLIRERTTAGRHAAKSRGPRWPRSASRPRRSKTSSASSTASPSKPTSWSPTRRSKPLGENARKTMDEIVAAVKRVTDFTAEIPRFHPALKRSN